MKNGFTKILVFTALAVMGFSARIFAADLVVAENGAGGAYSTISDAIAAAADGDRIFITPKSGGAPYSENFTITQNLQLLSNVEGQKFVIQGTITISPVNPSTVISIIGMKNNQGGITASAAPSGDRSTINILNCEFLNGNVNIDQNNYYANIASNVVFGAISIRYGKVIGNDVTIASSVTGTMGIYVNNDASATNDTIWIVGNKITNNGYYNCYSIYWNNSNQYFSIMNNFTKITSGYHYNYLNVGIYIYTSKNSSTGKNEIVNNTVKQTAAGANIAAGMYFYSIPANSYITAMNNLILSEQGYPYYYGIYGYSISGIVTASYTYGNYFSTPLSSITNDGTNNFTSNTSIDSDGRPAGSSDCVNAGNADSTYYDIDLTRNDVGCYGGSFTLDNFFPLTGAARVYFMLAPRRIIVGNTIGIKAEAFDR